MNDHHITVKFEGKGFSSSEKSALLMAMEKWARAHTGKDVQVFLQRLEDDLRPRRLMDAAERAKL